MIPLNFIVCRNTDVKCPDVYKHDISETQNFNASLWVVREDISEEGRVYTSVYRLLKGMDGVTHILNVTIGLFQQIYFMIDRLGHF